MSGPKPRYSVKKVAEAFEKAGGNKTLTAKILGCNRRTLFDYTTKHPELLEVAEHACEGDVDIAEAQIVKLMKEGNLRAIEFFLRNSPGGKKRGWSDRKEVTGAEGKDIGTITLYIPDNGRRTE